MYGIIIKINNCKITKHYNNYKILVNENEVEKYDNHLNEKIEHYKKIFENNEILVRKSDKLDEYFNEKRKNYF